jgi:hypothetical protein
LRKAKLRGRRKVDSKAQPDKLHALRGSTHIELKLVNLIRAHIKAWRTQGYPGVTRTTFDLLEWWRRKGREFPHASKQRRFSILSNDSCPRCAENGETGRMIPPI